MVLLNPSASAPPVNFFIDLFINVWSNIFDNAACDLIVGFTCEKERTGKTNYGNNKKFDSKLTDDF